MTQPNDDIYLENQQYVSAIEKDLTTDYEIANRLKNYATVNTAEPVATHLPYNLGTEGVENEETIKDTQMELNENSIITEIENAGLDLYNLKTCDYSADAELSLNKQLYMPEALEMSLVTEEETPSTWIDAMKLLNTDPVNIYESINESPIALPTAIQTYMHLENTPLVPQMKAPNSDVNLLKNLTADADICKCVDCKCGPFNNCQGNDESGCCGGKKSSTATTTGNNTYETYLEQPVAPSTTQQNTSCCGSSKSNEPPTTAPIVLEKGCCGNKTQTNPVQPTTHPPSSDCCVVVCLKSLEQLKDMLTKAKGCGAFEKLTIGCVPSELCAVKK